MIKILTTLETVIFYGILVIIFSTLHFLVKSVTIKYKYKKLMFV